MSGISGLDNIRMPSGGGGNLPPAWQTLKNDTSGLQNFIKQESAPTTEYNNISSIGSLVVDLDQKVGNVLGDITSILNSKTPLPSGTSVNLQNSYKALKQAYFGTNGYNGIQHQLVELAANTDDNPTNQCESINKLLTGPEMTNALNDIMDNVNQMGG